MPGPDTDHLVAQRFMVWHLESAPGVVSAAPPAKRHWHDRRGLFTGWATENCCWGGVGRGMCDLFAPSTESRHATEIVIAETVRRGLIHRVVPVKHGSPEVACDLISADGTPLASGRGETTALAICRAVLGLPKEGGSAC